jgi:predicted HTH transcriptional regulator
MIPSESVSVNDRQLEGLRKLISHGEGLHLEFKRKASHPDKIVRELIAFANTDGGTLLIGIDDNGSMAGVKYPEEEVLAIHQSLQKHCYPTLHLEESIIPISMKKFVVRLDVASGPARPHYFRMANGPKESYVRSNDSSVKASREMLEIVRRSKQKKDTRFIFGAAEKTLMEYLEQKGSISLDEFRTIAGLNHFMAAKKLILLVLANVLKIHATEKGDVYSRTDSGI